MTRASLLRKIVGLLSRADGSAEGRSAARVAERLRQQHQVTEPEIAAARQTLDDDNAIVATFKADSPWLFNLAMLLAELSDLKMATGLDGDLRLIGPGAGRTARRAACIRAMVEERMAALSVPAIAKRQNFDDLFGRSLFFSFGSGSSIEMLRMIYGSSAEDVLRTALVMVVLVPDVQDAKRRREQPSREPEEQGTEEQGTEEQISPRPPPETEEDERAAPETEQIHPDIDRLNQIAMRANQAALAAVQVLQSRPSWAIIPNTTTALVPT